jgi:hypothetical protein
MMTEFPAYYSDDKYYVKNSFVKLIDTRVLRVLLDHSLVTMVSMFPKIYRLNADLPGCAQARQERVIRMLYGLVVTRDRRAQL